MKCAAVSLPTGDACGKEADYLIEFKDGDKVYACQACTLRLGQVAGNHGARIKATKLGVVT